MYIWFAPLCCCYETGQSVTSHELLEFSCWGCDLLLFLSSFKKGVKAASHSSVMIISPPPPTHTHTHTVQWSYFSNSPVVLSPLSPLLTPPQRVQKKSMGIDFREGGERGWNSREGAGGRQRQRATGGEVRDPKRNMHVMPQLKVTDVNLSVTTDYGV